MLLHIDILFECWLWTKAYFLDSAHQVSLNHCRKETKKEFLKQTSGCVYLNLEAQQEEANSALSYRRPLARLHAFKFHESAAPNKADATINLTSYSLGQRMICRRRKMKCPWTISAESIQAEWNVGVFEV